MTNQEIYLARAAEAYDRLIDYEKRQRGAVRTER